MKSQKDQGKKALQQRKDAEDKPKTNTRSKSGTQDEEMKDETKKITTTSISGGSQSTLQQEETKKRNTQKATKPQKDQPGVTMESLIVPESTKDSRERVKFQGIREESASNQVCQVCYQMVFYPETKEEESEKSSEQQVDIKEQDAKYLYTIVYCQDCSAPAHWGCIGMQVQLQEYNKGTVKYFIFRCDKCKIKQQAGQTPAKVKYVESSSDKQFNCHVCDQKEGLMFGINVKKSDEEVQQYLFVHYICALTFPSIFAIDNNSTPMLKFIFRRNYDWKTQSTQSKKKGAEGCILCKSTIGQQLKCSSEPLGVICGKTAHAYCIANSVSGYMFDTCNEDSDAEKNHLLRWSYQVQPGKDNKLEVRTNCSEHQSHIKYCYVNCENQGCENLVMCECCQTWYHQPCQEEEAVENEQFKCDKCKFWQGHMQNPILDIALKRKSYRQLIDQLAQEKLTSLTFQDKFYKGEQKYFEQLLMLNAWLTIADYQFKESASAEMIEFLTQEKKKFMLTLNPVMKSLDDLKKSKNDEARKFIAEHEIPKLQDVLDQQLNTNQEAIKHNQKVVKDSLELYDKVFAKFKIVNDEIEDLKDTEKRSTLLTEVAKLFKTSKKPSGDKVRSLMEELDQMGMTDYSSFKVLQDIIKDYNLWEKNALEQFNKGDMPEESQLKQKFLNFKNTKAGVKLVDSKYRVLKDYLSNRTTMAEAQKIMDQSKTLRVEPGEDITYMQKVMDLVQNYEKTICKIESSPNVKNRVKTTFQNLMIMACLPIKSSKCDELLDHWHVSAKWQARAKEFLRNKFNDDEERMDIDEGNRDVKKRYTWTLDAAQALLDELQANRHIYYDQKVLAYVKEKITVIEKLKKQLPVILKEKHQEKIIEDYLRELRGYETVDLEYEIHKVEEKFKLVKDVKAAVDNDGRQKQNVEQLDSVARRVNELSIAQENPIEIQWDMRLMLEAKVQVAKNLKKEFQEVLNQYQDTFTKNMVAELKAIVHKADKEHSLDMKNEQKILDNIPFSEEWFLLTYEKLKKVTGKLLHQCDFKDYIQLSTVLQEEKDCANLLKGLNKPPEILVGAAQNLWKSLSGVKWLFELRRLIGAQDNNKDGVDLKKVLEQDKKAQEIGIDYDKELQRNNVYSRYFYEFKRIVECIQEFEKQFGTPKKVVKTLEANYHRLDDFKVECEKLTEVLQSHKISSQSDELELLSKIHTFIEFLKQYNQLTSEYPDKLPYEQAMILSQLARDKRVPEDLGILKLLQDKVAKFEKFTREYSDYKRFRDRTKKSSNAQLTDARFTWKFVKKLIEDSKTLSIEKDSPEDFDEKMLEEDLQAYDKWRAKAENLIVTLEEDEVALNHKENRQEFETLKKQMRQIPVYDKDLFVKMQVFEWVFSSLDMLESTDKEPLTLGTWESQIKQGEAYTASISGIKNQPIYQRLLWEVEQAKQVIEFCSTQKNNQKSLASKFNLDKVGNYAFFKNKHGKKKINQMLEQARQSKLDLAEEVRCLDVWIKDFDKYNKMHENGTLYTEFSYDRVKDIAKQMYLSPLDYSDIYHEVREKIDKADMIKLDLKKILQEYEAQSQFQIGKQQGRIKRLKFSRISYHLKLYHKECNIKGIKEIDTIKEKVVQSREKLQEVSATLSELASLPQDQPKLLKEKLALAQRLFSEVELDMEAEEKPVRRELFETQLRLVFDNAQKLPLEEFKYLEKEFDAVRNELQDDKVHAKFIEIKSIVTEYSRKLNRIDSKDELDQLKAEVEQACPMIDFNQVIVDKGAEILLGKRTKRLEVQSSDSEEDQVISTKRNQPPPKKKPPPKPKSSSSSGGSSSSSSSNQSSDSGDSSDDEASSSDSSDSASSSDSENLNIAKNRSRRNIVPNLNSDFIYENPAIAAQQKIAQQENMSPEEKAKFDKRQKKQAKQKRREQKRKEKEKARRMKRQLEEHRERNKVNPSRKQIGKKQDADQSLSLGVQISQDQMLQKQLQNMKNKIREQSRTKIMEHLQLPDTVFSELDKDQQKQAVTELENEIFIKNSEVDHYYRKRIGDIVENIKWLSTGHREISELIAGRKHLNFLKLLIPHHAFKETIVQTETNIRQRKEQIKQQKKQLAMRANPELAKEESKVEDEVTVPQEQKMLKMLYGGNDNAPIITKQELPKVKIQRADSDQEYIQDDDDLESYDSNPALFSDEEDVPQQNKLMPPQIYDTYKSPMYQEQQQQYLPPMQQIPQVRVAYNPYEILETKYGRFAQKKSQEPILYDPTKAKQGLKKIGQMEKNTAPVGSLLKVWEGILPFAQDSSVNTTFYSTMDIQTFQQLPEIPHTLQLRGKAKMDDTVNHFLRLRKDKRVIKGWITRKNHKNQENNDKYQKMFDELEQTKKSALFTMLKDMHIYIIPITPKTKGFCQQLGIEPQPIYNKEPLDFDVSEETHLYAFLGQIKQTFINKHNFLNPEVLRIAAVIAQPSSQEVKNDKSFSPITSDEEDNPKHKAQILQKVKTEDMPSINRQQQMQQPDLQRVIKTDQDVKMRDESITKKEDDDEDVDINEIIDGFRNQQLDIQSIQLKLLPIIHKVKGEKEQRLTQFLQDLIASLNNQPQITPQQQINQQGYQQQQMIQQSPMNVGYVAPQMRPQFPVGISPQEQLQQQPARFTPQAPLNQPNQFIPQYRQQFQQLQQNQPQQYMGQLPPQIRPQQNVYPQGISGQPPINQFQQQQFTPQRQQFAGDAYRMPSQQPLQQYPQMPMEPGIPPIRPPPGQMLPGQLRPGPPQQQPPQGMMGMYNPQQQQHPQR